MDDRAMWNLGWELCLPIEPQSDIGSAFQYLFKLQLDILLLDIGPPLFIQLLSPENVVYPKSIDHGPT